MTPDLGATPRIGLLLANASGLTPARELSCRNDDHAR
jgi:hypothetical protein